ncbi:MAG TPA: hypothetical protein VM223_21095 [Planctomycetota bacterium]|nr:hypothetical protein [Planctomycetota bacterium]
MAPDVPQVADGYSTLEMNPGRILRAIACIGYTPASEICNTAGNRVEAEATRISIELQREPDVAETRHNIATLTEPAK